MCWHLGTDLFVALGGRPGTTQMQDYVMGQSPSVQLWSCSSILKYHVFIESITNNICPITLYSEAHTSFYGTHMRENWDLSAALPHQLDSTWPESCFQEVTNSGLLQGLHASSVFQYFQSVACNYCVARTMSAQVSLQAAVMMLEPEKYHLQPCVHLNPNM